MRVRRATRDRVTALSRRARTSGDTVVTRALDLYEREEFWAEWERAHRELSTSEAAEEAAELAPWDAASAEDLRTHDADP